MNLLLYAEARRILTRPRGRHSAGQWIGDQLPALPDSLFEELGYTGATAAEDDADDYLDESLNDMFRRLAEPALSY